MFNSLTSIIILVQIDIYYLMRAYFEYLTRCIEIVSLSNVTNLYYYNHIHVCNKGNLPNDSH